MTQYDRKQLLNMQQAIKNFKENNISLASFINTMDFLYRAIEENNETWNHLFGNALINLDIVNAGVSDDVTAKLIENFVLKATSNLEKLVVGRLQGLVEVQITLPEVMQKIINLLNNNISHEDAANWAYSIIRGF